MIKSEYPYNDNDSKVVLLTPRFYRGNMNKTKPY